MTINDTQGTLTNDKDTSCTAQDVDSRPTPEGQDTPLETPQNDFHDAQATSEPTPDVESSNALSDNTQEPPRTPTENKHPDHPHTPTENPAPPRKPFEQDTPSMFRISHSNDFRNGDLNERRTILTEDCQTADIVSADYFFSNLLPPIPEGVPNLIDDIERVLLKKRRLGYDDKGVLCWRCFRGKKKEDDFFLPLEAIFGDIVQLINTRLCITNTHTYMMRPNMAPYSDRDERMRPDGAFVKGSGGSGDDVHYHWYDIACVGEFKKIAREGQKVDNISKVLYGMHHMMATDAARRFALGFTIEATTMSLWHTSRAALFKCYFDYNKDPRQLIRFFISIAFASQNGQETGWDTTVTRLGIDDNKEMQYAYDVKGVKYDTKVKLADYATDAVMGRGSRVFMVEEEIEGGTKKRRVLKDYWRDSDRPSESEIVDHLLDDVEAHCGREGRKCVEQHIVGIKEEVVVEVDGEEDDTTNVIMRGAVPHVERQERLMKAEGSKKYCYRSIGPMQSLDGNAKNASKPRGRMQPQPERKSIRQLKHCRVVYEEYATPIQDLTKLSHVVQALLGVTQALYYIHKAGWVHRDISAGNIYWYKGKGLLSDFEYAKKMGTAAEHEVKTGTIIFMAYEAITRQFAHVDSFLISKRHPVSNQVFFHNPLHDMESIFWVYAFSLLDADTKDRVAWKNIVDMLFSGLEQSTAERKDFVFGRSVHVGNFSKHLGEERVDALDFMLSLRNILAKSYNESEAVLPSRPIDKEKFIGLQKAFETVWNDCLGCLREKDVPLVRAGTKRRAETELPREEPRKRTKQKHTSNTGIDDNAV